MFSEKKEPTRQYFSVAIPGQSNGDYIMPPLPPKFEDKNHRSKPISNNKRILDSRFGDEESQPGTK
jgi:hypothetical protein